jgi:hypothetical protein
MRATARILTLLFGALFIPRPVRAQLPFYTDDPAVTAPYVLHFEFFNEFDGLQRMQYPNLDQNTANYKLNYGLPHHLELDVDAPYLAVLRGDGRANATGVGDTDMGIKWEFHEKTARSWLPAMGASLYIEFPTGNERKQLGSGLTDDWLNFITQWPLTAKTRVNTNLGFLFAGNTSTGVVGIQTARGHVFTGGLSMLHDFTPRLTLGGEVYGGIADNDALGRSQLQALVGGQYSVRNGISLGFGLVGGKYVASPRVGAQIGIAMDFPAFFGRRQGVNSLH